MFNIQAELSGNLNVYNTFFQSRAAVSTPQKPTVPLVWDLYMDAEKPIQASAGKNAVFSDTAARENTAPAMLESAAQETASPAALESAAWENASPAMLESTAWENTSPAFLNSLYTESAAPVPLAAFTQAESRAAPLAVSSETFAFGSAGEGAATVTYLSPVSGDVDMLRAVNDRLKTQARRYPHPITNDMDRPE